MGYPVLQTIIYRPFPDPLRMLTCKLQAADLAASVDGDVAAFAAVALLDQPQQEGPAVDAAGGAQEGRQQESVFSPAHTLQSRHITAQQPLERPDLLT